MSSFDLGSQIRTGTLIPAQAWDGDDPLTTSDTLALNTANDEGVAVVVTTGTVAAGANIEIAFHQGDENDFVPGAANEIDEKYIISAPEIDATDNASYVFSIKTGQPYLKVVVTRGGTDAAAIAVTGIVGYLANAPA